MLSLNDVGRKGKERGGKAGFSLPATSTPSHRGTASSAAPAERKALPFCRGVPEREEREGSQKILTELPRFVQRSAPPGAEFSVFQLRTTRNPPLRPCPPPSRALLPLPASPSRLRARSGPHLSLSFPSGRARRSAAETRAVPQKSQCPSLRATTPWQVWGAGGATWRRQRGPPPPRVGGCAVRHRRGPVEPLPLRRAAVLRCLDPGRTCAS